ncbi:MAG TPA: glycosyltransferase family 2 protein [Pyrinomonadaceae bacterium]|jgi:glycosyltransferase involved in cell wall biosynthesis|nr:glycosyltransferase family 2 protein [Pyrinomonadaceae bacterium]
MKISATIITFNEESNIKAACESVAWADEVVVVDSNSTDATRQLAEARGARVITNAWPGFGAQKQFAVEQARYEWIFSLDADERVSDELKKSIQSLRTKPEAQLADAYQIARRTYYQQRWIRGGGWYPDRQLRLFRKTKGRWKQRHIHESVAMDAGARVEKLTGDLLHYTSAGAAHHHRMIGERYAPLAALQMFEEGRRTSVFGVASAGPVAFIRSLILKGGLRDGFAGFTIASFAAHHAFLKHLMLWEKQAADNTEDRDSHR